MSLNSISGAGGLNPSYGPIFPPRKLSSRKLEDEPVPSPNLPVQTEPNPEVAVDPAVLLQIAQTNAAAMLMPSPKDQHSAGIRAYRAQQVSGLPSMGANAQSDSPEKEPKGNSKGNQTQEEVDQ